MENCWFATNEMVPARIIPASLDPKVLKAAGWLVAGRRVRSETPLLREHLRIMCWLVVEKKLDPLFNQKQAVERAMSGISSRNMVDMRRMNCHALGTDLDKFHSLANERRALHAWAHGINKTSFTVRMPSSRNRTETY